MLKHPKPPIPPQPIHIPISHPPTQKSNLYKPNPPKTLKNNSSPPHQAHPQLPRNGTDRRPIKTTPHENTHIPKASRTGSRAEQRGAHLRGSGRRRWRQRWVEVGERKNNEGCGRGWAFGCDRLHTLPTSIFLPFQLYLFNYFFVIFIYFFYHVVNGSSQILTTTNKINYTTYITYTSYIFNLKL